LTRLGRKTPSRNLHECRSSRELVEGDPTVENHPDHFVLSCECSVPRFSPSHSSSRSGRTHPSLCVTHRTSIASHNVFYLCKTCAVGLSIIYSVRAMTTLDAPSLRSQSSPRELVCVSEVQSTCVIDTLPQSIYGLWRYEFLLTFNHSHAGALGLRMLGVVSSR